jgi:NitT/TauT family transport system ATP-binding protein
MTEPAVVELKGVSKVFGSGGDVGVRALSDIDLSIGRGEFVSLIGPSGCGKSTLLRIIGDLTSPTAGTVTVNGKPAPRARLDRDYGMVFQAPVLFDWRTVQKNVELPLEITGRPAAEREAKAREMLALVELSDFADRQPWQLSGGMQQRVAIARALAYQPQLLLMDEPFASVDAQTRADLEDLVRRLHGELELSVVLVTHDMDEAVYMSDRVVVLNGRPATIATVLDVDLGATRDQVETKSTPRFAELRSEVYRIIHPANSTR